MLKPDDIEYAVENTRVVLAPKQTIATFGHTVFRFHLISELMDSVGEVRIRDGNIHAERPEIVTPDMFSKLLLEGFGDRADEFAQRAGERLGQLAILKYGFRIRKTDVVEHLVHDPVEDVIARVREEAMETGDSGRAIIHGVDEGWEVCLLKFTIDLIGRSAGDNLGDFRSRGLI